MLLGVDIFGCLLLAGLIHGIIELQWPFHWLTPTGVGEGEKWKSKNEEISQEVMKRLSDII